VECPMVKNGFAMVDDSRIQTLNSRASYVA
jgi:hypothetical protein